jgi:hypothetical protein
MSWSDALSLVVAAALVTACSGGDGKGGPGDDDDDTTGTTDPFVKFVDPPGETNGDFACFTPAEEPTWLVADLDPAKVATFPIDGLVEDFEEGTAVPSANVDLFYADSPAGTPDDAGQSDVSGLISLEGPSCTPITYRVNTVGGPVATRETFKVHQVYGYPTGASITGASYVSVSDITYQLIPSILGIQVQPGLSIIAGTAYDCSRDAALPSDDPSGKIEGAQIVVFDASDRIPETLGVNYFIEEFPARAQVATSEDGLWVASNVPPGRVRVEMWGEVGGALVKLGATEVEAKADSIAIANIFAGYGDGVKGPAACASAR